MSNVQYGDARSVLGTDTITYEMSCRATGEVGEMTLPALKLRQAGTPTAEYSTFPWFVVRASDRFKRPDALVNVVHIGRLTNMCRRMSGLFVVWAGWSATYAKAPAARGDQLRTGDFLIMLSLQCREQG